jgi:hypothetical protein
MSSKLHQIAFIVFDVIPLGDQHGRTSRQRIIIQRGCVLELLDKCLHIPMFAMKNGANIGFLITAKQGETVFELYSVVWVLVNFCPWLPRSATFRYGIAFK